MTLLDLSHFQADAGPIDYPAVRAKVAGAYVKLTQAATYIDPAWPKHWAGLRGIPRGGYHFCGRMDNLGHVTYQDPTAEAHHFADVLTKAAWELRPVVDIEAPGANPAWLRAFLAALRASTGIRRLRVYTSHNLITGPLTPATWIDPDTDLWIARYNPTLGFDHPQLVLWQHTDSGRVPGITGLVDLSVELHGWTPRADTAAPAPAPVPLPEEADISATPLTPLPASPGAYRYAVPVETAATGSQVANAMWISYTAVYGDATVTIVALDGHGKVIDTPTPYTLANNNNNVYPVPGPARTVTVEGRGALVATLLARPK